MKVVNGFLLTRCSFKADDKLAHLGLPSANEFDDFRVKVSEIISWNSSEDGMHTTIRTIVGDFTIEETMEDLDILMLSK
jgi:hypothetical protein